MVELTDKQIDFIREQIAANGVKIEDLQFNLLDHICCVIENEMSEGEDFKLFFDKVFPRFFRYHLSEIQEETELLLTFKHFYAMKKTVNITGISVVLLMLLFTILKLFHLPGASVTLIVEVVLFSFLFLPLMIVLKFKDDGAIINKLVLSGGLVLGIISAIGILAKLMHWPFATPFMLIGISGFTFVYVPLYFFTNYRKPELKFNTLVNSVLMMSVGGLLFSLFSLHGTRLTESNKAVYTFLLQESIRSASSSTNTISAANREKARVNLDELQTVKIQLLASKLTIDKTQILKMGEANAYELISNDALLKDHLNSDAQLKLNKLIANLETELQITLSSTAKPINWDGYTLKDALQQLTLFQIRCQRQLNVK